MLARSVIACCSLLFAVHTTAADVSPVAPRVVTEPVRYDTDDPAIWVNTENPAASLVVGTDKDVDGALYVFGLDGKIVQDKVVRGLLRPNNVDIAGDLAVVAERYAHRLRVYRLPGMEPIDGGGIPVFEDERGRDVMGIALYTRQGDGAVFAFVSRSETFAPTEGYLHQYRLFDAGTGTMRGVFVRAFGDWSGLKEIEAITVDDELGYVYYSDEGYGIRKYAADPLADGADEQLAEFGQHDFTEDHEGLSIYRRADGSGYLFASDQQANRFNIYAREGNPGNPHTHTLLASVYLGTDESDGSELDTTPLPGFPGGLFVAMSTDRTFRFYALEDILKAAGLAP